MLILSSFCLYLSLFCAIMSTLIYEDVIDTKKCGYGFYLLQTIISLGLALILKKIGW